MHLTTAGGWGGREMYPPEAAALQRKRGHTVSVTAKPGTPLAAFLEKSDPDHDLVPAGPYLDPLAAWRLSRVLKRRQPEIIHVHLSRDLALVETSLGLAGMRPPVILHKHIASAGNKKDILHRYLYGRVAAVIAVSDFVRRSLLASCPLDDDKIRVIHFGLDPARFAATVDPDRRRAVRGELGAEDSSLALAAVVGRMEPRKGQEIFLRAAPAALSAAPRLRFALVGAQEGDYGRKIESLARELDPRTVATISGHRGDILEVFAALDILVVPSLEEAFGLVAVEGMLASLPVVAARAGALPEFVIEGESGTLVPPSDPAALAVRLAALANDPERRKALGARARDWALKNLSLEKHLDSLDSLYEECLGKAGEP